MFELRLEAFHQKLAQKKLDGFIVSNHFNIFYLCSFKGISPTEREALLIFSPKPTLITAKLYQAEAKRLESKNLSIKIVAERNQIFELVTKLLSQPHLRGENSSHVGGVKVGFEEEDLKVSELKEFEKALPKVKLVPTKNFVEDLRIIKTENEIKNIEKAQVISQQAFGQLVKTLKIGQTEAEIAENLEKIIKNLGGQGLAFESIVASGPNSARPHYLTGQRPIAKGEVLLLDFGAKYGNYCADLSRTIFIGRAQDQHRNIYNHVKEAQLQAMTKIRNGVKSSEAYKFAANHFKKHKLDRYFLHSLGHGIGLEVHERPHLRPASTQGEPAIDDVLTEGMIFSVEPGLYFPSWGGIRIEDLVTIKNGKAKVLGQLTEEIVIV